MCPPAQSTAGPARQDNLRHARHPKRLNGSGLTPRGRARGAVGSGHPVGAPRRLHVPYPERRGAARTRSARAARPTSKDSSAASSRASSRNARAAPAACGCSTSTAGASPWMAYVDGRFHDREAAAWDATALPRAAMAEHLRAYTAGWNTTVEYFAGDERLPENVRAFNEANGIAAVQVAPLALPTHNLGWIALASADAFVVRDARGAVPSWRPPRSRRRSRSTSIGSPSRAAARRGVRRRSRSATGWRATSTTR